MGLLSNLTGAISNLFSPKPAAPPLTSTFSNPSAPFLLTGKLDTRTLPKATSQPLVSAGNVIGAGGTAQSSFGGSGAVLKSGGAGYSWSPLASSGGSGIANISSSFIPAPNRITTPTKNYTIVPSVLPTPSISPVPQASFGFSPAGGTTGIAGGQGLLPGSVGSVSRGGFGMGAGQMSGTKLLQQQNKDLLQKGSTTQGSNIKLFTNAFAPKIPGFVPAIPSQQINAAKLASAQSKDTTLPAGGDAATFQSALTQGVQDRFGEISSINIPKTPMMLGLPEGVTTPVPATDGSGVPRFIRFAGSPNIFDTSTGSYVADPSMITSQVADVATPRPGVKTEGDYATLNNQNLSQEELQTLGLGKPTEPIVDKTLETDQPSMFNLQQEYARLQQESGVTDAISQWKDLQSQLVAIETTLKENRDSIMADPDMSLATKEGRINYLFRDSMEARTYEAMTKRLDALSGFIDKQSAAINQQLGFANQDFQNQLAYTKATQPTGDQFSLQEIGGQGYVFNKSTGEFKPVGTGGGVSTKSEQEILKALNASDAWKNYQTAKNYTSVMNNTMMRFDANKDGKLDAQEWAKFSNDDPAIRQFATAMVRVQDPIASRLADGGDVLAGNSIADRLEMELRRFAVGANATPANLESAWNGAVTTLNGTWAPEGIAAERQIRAAFGGSNPLGLTPPSGMSSGGAASDFSW